MTKNEFLQRFHLSPLAESSHNYKHAAPLKSAAVLIGLVDSPTSNLGLQVLLTKRASHLRHHPSQISFPGGKAEPEDGSMISTALREAYEETGLSPDSVTVIGQLSTYEVISGYLITPIIAIINTQPLYQQDENEVAEIFQVPLQHLLQSNNHTSFNVLRNGQQLNIHFFPYKHYNIWGATAAMLKDLIEHVR